MVSLASGLLLAVVAAAPPPPGPCERFDEARNLLKAGRPDTARPIFQGCLDTDPQAPDVLWRALLGVALSDDLAGHPASAAIHYDRFLRSSRDTASSEWLQRRADAARELERLEPLVLKTRAIVTVVSTPAGATAEVVGDDGRRLIRTDTPLRAFLRPGRYTVKVRYEGFGLLERELVVVAGRRIEVDLMLREQRPPPDPDVRTPAEPIVVPTRPPPEDPGPWVLLGVGAASLVAGATVAGVMVGRVDAYEALVDQSDDPDVNRRAQGIADEIHVLQPTYIALLGVGAALITGAIVWKVAADDGGDGEAPAGATVGFGTDGHGAFGWVGGHF